MNEDEERTGKAKTPKKKSDLRKGTKAFTKFATLGTVAGAGIGTYATVKSIADEAADEMRNRQAIVVPENAVEDGSNDQAQVEATSEAVAHGAKHGAKIGLQTGALVGLGAAGIATRRRRDDESDEPDSKAARYGNAATRYGFKHPVIAGMAGAGAIGTVLAGDAIIDAGDRREAMKEVASLPEEEQEAAEKKVREEHPIGPGLQTAVVAANAGLATRYAVWLPLTGAAAVGDVRAWRRRRREEKEGEQADNKAPDTKPESWAAREEEKKAPDADKGEAQR